MKAVTLLTYCSFCCAVTWAQNAATTVDVDANANRHPISSQIYGLCFGATSDLSTLNFTMNRYGGDSSTRYNWEQNADNRGNDWYYESFADDSATPGFRGDNFITLTRAAGTNAEALITIPMIPYVGKVAADRSSLRSFSIAKYGPQTGYDPYQPDAGNGISTASGNPYITANNPNDASTPNSVALQQGWIQHIIGQWGTAANGGLKYYIMDNEPSIWFGTHRDVHPIGPRYAEIYNDYLTYAAAVRTADPNAIIVGPEEWGWLGEYFSGYDQQNGAGGSNSDYNTHNQTYFYPWFLQQLYSYQQSSGQQLLNVLSVHYYPQDASGSDDDSPATQKIRNESTRSLWDPNYVDQSWIPSVGINGGKIYLIPTLKNWVSQYYPGLKTAITEYDLYDEANLNGATAQADALGIFGREGLDIATRWTVPLNPSPTYLALQIYRNYDGAKSTFGDTSISAAVADPDYLSSFAAVRSSDGALTVMVINKQTGTTPLTLNLANFSASGTASVWQISSAIQTAISHLPSVPVSANTLSATLPSQSITLFVIPPAVAAHPSVVSLTPSSGSGSSPQTFTAIFSDTSGASTLNALFLLVNKTITAANGCYVEYYPTSNLLYLKNDLGTGLSAGIVPGSSATVSNSQCTLSGTGSSFSTSGNNATLSLALAITSSAYNNSYLYASDKAGNNTGWVQKGTWGTPQSPTVTGVSGTGSPFTAVFSDPSGAASLNAAFLLLNTSLSGANGCYVEYYPSTNLLSLKNDANSGLAGSVTPGSSATVSNGHCILAGTGSSYSISGSTATLAVSVTWSNFATSPNIYLWASDKNGTNSGWVEKPLP